MNSFKEEKAMSILLAVFVILGLSVLGMSTLYMMSAKDTWITDQQILQARWLAISAKEYFLESVVFYDTDFSDNGPISIDFAGGRIGIYYSSKTTKTAYVHFRGCVGGICRRFHQGFYANSNLPEFYQNYALGVFGGQAESLFIPIQGGGIYINGNLSISAKGEIASLTSFLKVNGNLTINPTLSGPTILSPVYVNGALTMNAGEYWWQGPISIQGDSFIRNNLSIYRGADEQASYIAGDAHVGGDIILDRANINGTLFYDQDDHTLDCNNCSIGAQQPEGLDPWPEQLYPWNWPTIPSLDTSYYESLLEFASNYGVQPAGGTLNLSGDLEGKIYFVRGNVFIEDDIWGGPAIIVARGDITADTEATVGSNILLVAAGDVILYETQGCIIYHGLYSGGSVEFKNLPGQATNHFASVLIPTHNKSINLEGYIETGKYGVHYCDGLSTVQGLIYNPFGSIIFNCGDVEGSVGVEDLSVTCCGEGPYSFYEHGILYQPNYFPLAVKGLYNIQQGGIQWVKW